MKRKTISSMMTFILKYFACAFFVLTSLLMLPVLLTSKEQGIDAFLAWWRLILCLIFAAIMPFAFSNIKRVRLDDKNLYVSNYLKQISIPLDSIISVTTERCPGFNIVIIGLENATEFGDEIRFVDKISALALFFQATNSSSFTPPIVTELIRVSDWEQRMINRPL